MKKGVITITACLMFLSFAFLVSATGRNNIIIEGVKTESTVKYNSPTNNDVLFRKTIAIDNENELIFVEITKVNVNNKRGNSVNTGDAIQTIVTIVFFFSSAALAILMNRKLAGCFLILALLITLLPGGLRIISANESPGGSNSANCGKGQDGTGQGCEVSEVIEEEPDDDETNQEDVIPDDEIESDEEEPETEDLPEVTEVEEENPNIIPSGFETAEMFASEVLSNFDCIKISSRDSSVEVIKDKNSIIGYVWSCDDSTNEQSLQYVLQLKDYLDTDSLGREIVVADCKLKFISPEGKVIGFRFPGDLVVRLATVE